jgi:hypothetical protein
MRTAQFLAQQKSIRSAPGLAVCQTLTRRSRWVLFRPETAQPAGAEQEGQGAPFVAFRDPTIEYGAGASAVLALERVNLSFGPSDFVGIVRPSGHRGLCAK